MMQIGAAELAAGRAAARRIERRRVFRMPRILEIERAVPGECLTVAARAGRQHAIEHVHAAQHRADDIVRLADAHEIARTIGSADAAPWHPACRTSRSAPRPPPGRRPHTRQIRSPAERAAERRRSCGKTPP